MCEKKRRVNTGARVRARVAHRVLLLWEMPTEPLESAVNTAAAAAAAAAGAEEAATTPDAAMTIGAADCANEPPSKRGPAVVSFAPTTEEDWAEAHQVLGEQLGLDWYPLIIQIRQAGLHEMAYALAIALRMVVEARTLVLARCAASMRSAPSLTRQSTPAVGGAVDAKDAVADERLLDIESRLGGLCTAAHAGSGYGWLTVARGSDAGRSSGKAAASDALRREDGRGMQLRGGVPREYPVT